MKAAAFVVIPLLWTGLSVQPAQAGPNENAKIAIHLASPTTKSACTRTQASPPCQSIVTAGDLAPEGYFAYVLVVDGDAAEGVSGLQFGITYNPAIEAGVDIFGWANCATLEFPMSGWPASGSGTLITWDRDNVCQRAEPGGTGTGVVAVAGYFYCAAYSADSLIIIPRPVDGAAKVASCASIEDTLESASVHRTPYPLGFAAFSQGTTLPGYNPCAGGGDEATGEGGGGGDRTDDAGGGDDGWGDGAGDGGDSTSPDNVWTNNFDGTFTLHDLPLAIRLGQAPMEFSQDPPTVTLTIPMPDGGFPAYRIFKSPILSNDQALLHPEVITCIGQGVDDPACATRFDFISGEGLGTGFHAIVLSTSNAFFIEPVADNPLLYRSVRHDPTIPPSAARLCLIEEVGEFVAPASPIPAPVGDYLRVFDFAVNMTGELTQAIGDSTTAECQMITLINRASAVFEREMSIRLRTVWLKAFPDPLSDPFVLGTENQTYTDGLGIDYDLGQLLSFQEGYGGDSERPGVCRAGLKANSSTRGSGIDDIEFLSTFVHEIAHQFGADESRNRRNTLGEICAQGLGPEPGTGSTFLCDPATASSGSCLVQATNDYYFHARAFEEVQTWIASGGNCAELVPTGNHPPEVSAGAQTYRIPRSTPFKLTAAGTDPDGDPLSWCWEETEARGQGPNRQGPLTLFRTWPPSQSPTRHFPRLPDLLGTPGYTFETLPNVDRTISMRITARDGRAIGGVSADTTLIFVQGTPFEITSPVAGDTVKAGGIWEVRWVGGCTECTPPLTATVRIHLSTNGGQTFSMLGSAPWSEGAACVGMPSVVSSNAIILVEAMQSIFFNVSDPFVISDDGVEQPCEVAAVQETGSPANREGLVVLPNPVRGTARFVWFGERFRPDAVLEVYDVSGRLVAELGHATLMGGEQSWTWHVGRGGGGPVRGVFVGVVKSGTGHVLGKGKVVIAR